MLKPTKSENCWYKKFELMLTRVTRRRAKAYSSSCSQTVSLSPTISLQFILGVCAAAKDCKNQSRVKTKLAENDWI